MSRFVVAPDGGKTFIAGPLGVISKLTPAETGGSFSIVEHPIAPGVLVPPHTYLDEDEFSYVLEGVVGVRIGNETAALAVLQSAWPARDCRAMARQSVFI